ncbi:MAG: long-chain fatty acid--CoA ligase [Burkholderiaceae bacterium]
MTPDIGLGNWIEQRARRAASRRALVFEGRTWTYAQLMQDIDRFAGLLRERGVERGTRVAFLGLNQPTFLIGLFAVARLGATFVPLNFRLTGPELSLIINDCAAHTLIVDAAHRPIIDGVRGELASVRQYLTVGDAVDGWQSAEAKAAPIDRGATVDPDDPAIIMYTSGTTGRPKGAMLTHSNLWWNNVNAIFNFDILQSDVTLVVAPLFHIGGLNVTTLITWQKGGTVVLHRSFDPGEALRAMTEFRITTMFGVPAMFQFMAQHPDFATADLSTVRMLVCGGAPCPLPLLEIYAQRGIAVQQGYGLTETAPMVTFLDPDYATARIGSSGTTPLFTEVRLIDGQGNTITRPGDRGEVLVRGPNVTPGYWNMPEATAAAIDADGWFRTGDVAYEDEEGFLYICDRVKDMIISGGENVYPAEVESVLFRHPAVSEVAVVGLPDPKWGETVAAVVALKPGATLDIEALRAFAESELARYKLPRRLEIVDALPRNATGKILKFELRKRFANA